MVSDGVNIRRIDCKTSCSVSNEHICGASATSKIVLFFNLCLHQMSRTQSSPCLWAMPIRNENRQTGSNVIVILDAKRHVSFLEFLCLLGTNCIGRTETI